MPDPPDDLQPLPILVLARLLVAGEKGAKYDQIRKDLEPLLGQRWSGGESTSHLEATLEDLASVGLLDRNERGRGKSKALFVALSDSGRSRALGALGLSELPPKTTWGSMVSKYLAARALGLPAPLGPAAKAFGSDGGFKAAVLRARHDLPVPEFVNLTKAQDAFLWKLLGHQTDRKFGVKSVRAFLLARALGESEPASEKESLRRLIVRDLKPRNSKAAELRAAAVRLWLEGTQADPRPTPTAPTAAANGAPSSALTLEEFAHRVVAAARSSPTGRFGDNKVFIAHAWKAVRDDPDFQGLSLEGFKQRLAEANRARLLDLSRADLVEAMDPDDVRASETAYYGAYFHFIRL